MQTEAATRRFYAEVWIHAPVVLRVAQVLAKDAGRGEDLAQEAMLKAFRFIDQLKPDSDARKWLLAILRNTWTDWIRADVRRPKESDLGDAHDSVADERPPVSAGTDDPRRVLETFSDSEVINALQKLPEEIRWTLLLVDVEGLDHSDAAEVLAVPVGTIKSRAHRGRAMLRETLLPLANNGRRSEKTPSTASQEIEK